MLEDCTQVMEKKGIPRQSSNVTKPNGFFERKNDPNSTVRNNGRVNRRRDNGSGRGTPCDLSSQRPRPQNPRPPAMYKRPRQKVGSGGRQREEVAETGVADTESSILQYGRSNRGNLSHLLKFTFADREPDTRPIRRYQKRLGPRFSIERYLQANYQFVVKDSGDYAVQACDPDALVKWELVEQVWTFSFGQTTCPICLQSPAAGKITKCGHVYCWACILHCLSLEDKNTCRCPICFESVYGTDLRSVKVIEKQEHKVGEEITLQLMKRARDSTFAVPCVHWEDREGRPQHIMDPLNTEYAKVLVASAAEIQTSVIEEERQALIKHMACAEDSEVCFVESALVMLSERELSLQITTLAAKENAVLMGQLESGSKDKGTMKTAAAAAHSPVITAPLGKNVSFDGSKIRKKYADAFDELEEEEEEESVVSGDITDHDDSESTDSMMSLSSSWPDNSSSLARLHPNTLCTAASSEDEPVNFPLDDDLVVEEPEVLDEYILTSEEAVAQLTVPTDDHSGPSSTNTTPSRITRNQSKRYFYFYQASDGQQIYLHSINARCICHEYGSLEQGPQTITAKIIDKDIIFMKEDIRKNLRYLSHVPKGCEFQVVEVQLQPPVVSKDTLHYFAGELKSRVQNRQRVKREDKRMARKQQIQEKMSYGIYPEVKLALDNPDHFPAPVSEGEERRRHSSLSNTTSLSAVNSGPQELNIHAAEFVPVPRTEPPPSNNPCAFSFAAALKKTKQPVPSVWGASNPSAAMAGPLPSHHADSEESESEDRVPVPLFQNSFSDAISKKMETLCAKDGEQVNNNNKGKLKKKKEKTLLFSTDMRRR